MTTPRPLILTYHAIDRGPPPLFIDPALFAVQLDVLRAAGAHLLTVSAMVDQMARGALEPNAVALTFDDGFSSVAEHAAPLLARHGWPATVFCVAGHLGRANDWPTQPQGVPRRPLLQAREIASLAATGFEIGGHTMSHPPLGRLDGAALEVEIVGCRRRLADVAQTPVRSFACPYGDPPSGPARELIEATYDSCCGTRMAVLDPSDDVHALPRIDAHYFRRPWLLARLLNGDRSYLRLRTVGTRARGMLVRDFT